MVKEILKNEVEEIERLIDSAYHKGYDEASSILRPEIEEYKRELIEANRRIAKLKEVLSNL